MADLRAIAMGILRTRNANAKKEGDILRDIESEDVEIMIEELRRCKTGRKVQVLLLLENNERMTTTEISEATNLFHNNISPVTKRLKKNELIEVYDGSRFMKPEEVNFTFKYHSLTDFGRELIGDLGQ